MDKTLGYDPEDASSNLAIPANFKNKFYYAKSMSSTIESLNCQ